MNLFPAKKLINICIINAMNYHGNQNLESHQSLTFITALD